MRALLLAAGLGTRLRPLTESTPKCLVPIHGRPLLSFWIDNLLQAGVDRCLVNTHYLAEQVEAYVDSSQLGERITLAYEEELLGTAGTLMAHLDFFDSDGGLLIHADNFCGESMVTLLGAHARRPAHCLMTMLTFDTDAPENCGIVEIDPNNVVVGFHEKVRNPPGCLANGAVYALSAELISRLPHEFAGARDFSTEVLPRLVGRIYSYRTEQLFLDIGTPDNYARANASSAIDTRSQCGPNQDQAR